MKNDPLPSSAYIEHIRAAANEASKFTDGMTYEEFASNRLVQLATVKLIENIGEASRRLTRDHPDVTHTFPNMPWAAMISMRNRLSHVYEDVSLPTVWRVAREELPVLLATLPN